MTGDAVRQRLEEISERASAATVGPWKAEYDGGLGERLDIVYVLGPDRSLLAVTQTIDNASEGKPFEDAAFIGAARSDVPRLVAALTAVLDHHNPRIYWQGTKPGFEPELGVSYTATKVMAEHVGCSCGGRSYPCPELAAVAAALEESK